MSKEVTVIRVGTYIESNQGLVIDHKPGVLPNTTIVACHLSHNSTHPFVIHTYMEDSGITHTGEYCKTMLEAVNAFKMRVA